MVWNGSVLSRSFSFLYFSLAVQPVLQFLTPFRLLQYRPLLRRVNHPTERFSIECYYRPRTKYDGRLYFQFVCLFTPGEGVPHLHPIILPLVPGPSRGVPQWLVPGPCPWGVPQSQVEGGRGVPQDRVPPPPPGQECPPWLGQDGVPPPSQVRWGTPAPLQDRLRLDRLCRGRHASCGFQVYSHHKIFLSPFYMVVVVSRMIFFNES